MVRVHLVKQLKIIAALDDLVINLHDIVLWLRIRFRGPLRNSVQLGLEMMI